jgi:dolichyl-phosphate-mannose--protein O-mannosyl transferase
VTLAIVTGATVWLILLAGIAVWSAVLARHRELLLGSRLIVRWLLSSWMSRIVLLTFWAIAGWHIFCQRP